MLVFNKSVGELYSSFISGTVIPIGSIKNNSVIISNNIEKNTVLFISSLSTHSNSDKPLLTKSDGYKTDRVTIHAIDKLVVEFLDDWCAQNQKTLKILGRSFDLESDEYFFYLNCLNKCKWSYIPRQEIYSSYHQLNMAEIVVFIDSTLGYEALSRRKKTAAFICRANSLNLPSERFGWPAKKDETGPFWTHELDVAVFNKIMDFLNNIENTGWNSVLNEHYDGLMDFDQDNLELQNLLKNLL
jgi:surface carbohydrate biosynthesis protein